MLGDFNNNAFCTDSHTSLKHILSDYNILVFEPTHLDGGLLDHVYVSNSFCVNIATTVVIKNIYFSDHDAVKLQITLRSNNDIEESINFSMV